MAGTAGLEPANAGIKTPCLNQLGDVPAENCPAEHDLLLSSTSSDWHYNDFISGLNPKLPIP